MQCNIHKSYIFSLALFFFSLFFAKSAVAVTQEFRFEKTGVVTTPVIDRLRTYDSAPSVIQEGNEVKVWYCGGGAVGDPYNTHDLIYYASYNAQTGATITAPERVVWPTLNDFLDDGDMACAVTVAKHQNPNIANFSGVMGAPQYKMWYECAPRTYRKNDGGRQGCFTQICHAVSDDGIHWRKLEALDSQGASWRFNEQSSVVENNQVVASAVITISQKVKDNIQLERRDGKLYAYFGDNDGCNNINNYGVGHPTAVTLEPQTDGFQRIKLWYYDSAGDWTSRAMTYVESWDGFHFEAPTKTNIQSPNRIKYFDVAVGGHNGFYFANTGAFDRNFFNYSWDGINWFWSDNRTYGFPPDVSVWAPVGDPHPDATLYTDYLANNFNVGSATACPAFGTSAVGNIYGWVNSLTNITILSTEGGRGPSDGCNQGECSCYNKEEDYNYCYDTNSHIPLDQPCSIRGSRGNSWAIYSLIGNLNYIGETPAPTPTPSPTPSYPTGDFNHDGVVNIQDFVVFSSKFGTSDSTVDLNSDGIVNIQDFVIFSSHFGETNS
jgi:hypothetical protein